MLGTADQPNGDAGQRREVPAASALSRLDQRAAERAAQARQRELIRQERRDADIKLTAEDPHTAAQQRKRGSGRKDIVRQQRDTSGYAIAIDEAQVRVLAQRGTSLAALAAAFGLGEDEIAKILNDPHS